MILRTFFACAVCFGDPNSLMNRGVPAAVFFMVGVVGFVLGVIAWTARGWAKRAEKFRDVNGV